MSFGSQEVVEEMIDRTQRQLTVQLELKSLMENLEKEQIKFTEGEQSKVQAAQMVALADQILKKIEENRYEALFPPSYIDELRFLSSIANKKAPAPP
ncbi:MAG: hypothetical protein JSR58_02340 [Verrucomicrobia bacterium]|nr:hypothetical protein [Verrucomicrobiota bacterium]